MEGSTAEATENAVMAIRRKTERGRERAKFYEDYGRLTSDMPIEALRAIKNGTNFHLSSKKFREKFPNSPGALDAAISGKELKEWGLDLDTLLCPEPKKGTVEYYARRIL